MVDKLRLDELDIGEIAMVDSCSVSLSTSKQHSLTCLHLLAYPSLQHRARSPEIEPMRSIKIGSDSSDITIEY